MTWAERCLLVGIILYSSFFHLMFTVLRFTAVLRVRSVAVMRSASRSLLAVVVTCWAVIGLAPASASPRPAASHYDHIFVIVEENHGFTDVIGNRAAPNLNALASA